MHHKIEWDVVITAALIGIIMLTDVKVDFGNGTTAAEGAINGYAHEGYTTENLIDENLSKIELEEPVMTDTITITITGAQTGAKYEDTCVSEIIVY